MSAMLFLPRVRKLNHFLVVGSTGIAVVSNVVKINQVVFDD
jgi:hypothetical protein